MAMELRQNRPAALEATLGAASQMVIDLAVAFFSTLFVVERIFSWFMGLAGWRVAIAKIGLRATCTR